MTQLVQVALSSRRAVRRGYGFVIATLFAGLTLLGVFDLSDETGFGTLRIEHLVLIAAYIAVVIARYTALGKSAQRTQEDRFPLAHVELGLLLLVGVAGVVQYVGGFRSVASPLVYIAVAFLASFTRRGAGPALVAIAIAYEAGLYFFTEGRSEALPFAIHAVFLAVFGVLNFLFTRVEIARVRDQSRRELEGERERVRSDARMFRLVSAPSAGGVRDEERLTRSSVEEAKQQLFHLLQLLHATLDLHTCVLLLRERDNSSKLRIAEMVTTSDQVGEGPFDAGGGAVGAVLKRESTMNLEHLRPGYKGLSYYVGPALVQAFCGVPIVDGGQVVGVLCADRLADTPFSEREQQVLSQSVAHVLRALENERVFVQLERSKREQTVLHRASQALGAALDEKAVLRAGVEAAMDIAPFDFAAVTLFDAEEKKHRVREVVCEDEELAGKIAKLVFRDNTSLVAMAVKNRHFLPYRGDFDAAHQVIFTKRKNLNGMRSALVLPLVVREDAVGTLVLAATRKGAFGEGVRSTLQVLANQLAVAMSNAQAVARLEEMATTDGLTKCLNKRAFLEELERKLTSARRFGRPLSLIVTDIDHFKSVNDTYGHATGDVVIKELGEILRNAKRDTDIVARFGGEEFCVLCEETDTEGARLLAERIREELKGTVFQTELGKLSVTASLGVATFHADDKSTPQSTHALFEASDKALYAAKHGGRDQVSLY